MKAWRIDKFELESMSCFACQNQASWLRCPLYQCTAICKKLWNFPLYCSSYQFITQLVRCGSLRAVLIARAACRPPSIARVTPVDKIGSTKQAASPTKRYPGPWKLRQMYDQSLCVYNDSDSIRASRSRKLISGVAARVSR